MGKEVKPVGFKTSPWTREIQPVTAWEVGISGLNSAVIFILKAQNNHHQNKAVYESFEKNNFD